MAVDLGTGSAVGQGTDGLVDVEAVQGSRLADTLVGGPADDVLVGNLGDDKIEGAGGADTALFADVVGPVEVDLRQGTVLGEASGNDSLTDIEDLVGTRQDDTFRGDGADNHLDGGAGDDYLTGFEGTDLLDGNTGIDECHDLVTELVNCEGAGPARHRSGSTTLGSLGGVSWLRVGAAG